MKRALFPLATLALSVAAWTGTVRAELPAPVKTLVDAERAFAAAAVAKGQKDAFLEYLADDSLLFRPGPVPGKMFYRMRPIPPGLLSWAPTFADVSAAADYGLSAGPYEYRKDGKADSPITGYGHFVSIWRKQKDGAWKVEVDLGVSHDKGAKAVADVTEADVIAFKAAPAPKPGAAAPAPTAKAGEKPAVTPLVAGTSSTSTAKPADKPAEAKPAEAKPGAATPAAPGASTTAPSATPPVPAAPAKPVDPVAQSLTEAEKAFAKAAATDGLMKAYRAVALDDLRIYRNGQLPVVGAKELEKAFGAGATGTAPTWDPVHTRVSASGDFGYTTGALATAGAAAANPMAAGARGPQQYYVHVWRRDASGAWKLLLDIVV